MTNSKQIQRRSIADWLAGTGAAVVGLALLVAGGVAVFVSSNGPGAVALIGAGLVLVVLVMLSDWMRGSRPPQTEPARAGVAPRPALGAGAGTDGGADGAPARAQGDGGNAVSQPQAASPASEPAPALLSAVNRGHGLAKRPALRRVDIAKLFSSRDEGKRVTGLAIIQKRPELGSTEVLLQAVADSRSTFEQYQGLLAARAAVDAGTLDGNDLAELRNELRRHLAAGHLAAANAALLAEQIVGPRS